MREGRWQQTAETRMLMDGCNRMRDFFKETVEFEDGLETFRNC